MDSHSSWPDRARLGGDVKQLERASANMLTGLPRAHVFGGAGFLLGLTGQAFGRLNPATMSDKIRMRDGDTMLIIVKEGQVIQFTPNMSLPHSEFVKRTIGQLPAGAWVGSVSKLDGEVVAITSKHFFGYQLPAPPEVAAAVKRAFE